MMPAQLIDATKLLHSGYRSRMDRGTACYNLPREERRAEAPALRLWDANDLLESEPMHWLVPGRIPEGSSGLFYGYQNSFKSQTLDDLLLSLATSRPDWMGLPIPEMAVVCVCAEGQRAARGERIQTWQHAHGYEIPRGRATYSFKPVPFNDARALRL